MISADSPCRTYIVYRNGLFAQGIRRMLEERGTMRIVGMADEAGKALKAVRALRPDVIIMEEPAGKGEQGCVETFLTHSTSGRVLTLSLDDNFATVYDRRRVTATGHAELVKAILEVGKSHISGRNQHPGKVAVAGPFESGPRNHHDKADHESRVRRIRKPEAKMPDTIQRPLGRKVKGR
jgi:chemotaxis response regulator CheB